MAESYRAQVMEWTEPCRQRRACRQSHPVHDFLFTYYSYPMGRLERWHPGPNVRLMRSAETAALEKNFSRKFYHFDDSSIILQTGSLSPGARVSSSTLPNSFVTKRRKSLQYVLQILEATAGRPGQFACHGLHEWAMVYRGQQVRHEGTSQLRLPQREIDALVESLPLCCSHYDAFRFFEPNAMPLNRWQLDLLSRPRHEQPGCIHANMDLYKWAYKSMPWISSRLLWETFGLATKARELDMRASPYDLRKFGYAPIPIETESGREQYQTLQKELASQAATLRKSLINALKSVL